MFRLLRRTALALTPLLLAAWGGPTLAADEAAAAGFEPMVTPAPCPAVGLLEVEGDTVECGTVTVPVDYSEPDGDVYELAFVVHKARSQAPFADPVIYLEGGPGVASPVNLADPYGLGSAQTRVATSSASNAT